MNSRAARGFSISTRRALKGLETEIAGEDEIGVPKPTGKKCTACRKGNVVAVTKMEFDAASGPAIIGPGSRHQYNRVKSYHCDRCGVVYAFPPKG